MNRIEYRIEYRSNRNVQAYVYVVRTYVTFGWLLLCGTFTALPVITKRNARASFLFSNKTKQKSDLNNSTYKIAMSHDTKTYVGDDNGVSDDDDNNNKQQTTTVLLQHQ
jgi:gamma-glutamylcysteine synthetase